MNQADPPSPYTAPAAPLENNEPAANQCLTPLALTYLLASRKWMQWTALAFCALLLLNLTDHVITTAMLWEFPEVSAVSIVIIAVLYLGFAVYVIPPLLKCARLVRNAAGGGDEYVALALGAHRQFWRRLGLGVLIISGVSIAVMLIVTAGINK